MDDKEKEKFGVIVDKGDSAENKTDVVKEQSDISDKPPDSSNLPPDAEKKENIDIKQPESENKTSEPEETNENFEKKEEGKKEHEVIHKKDGRLHIYVRQDKYKGELKSKNWVGRLYFDGKQKISSSGTPNLEEAIPILEKWFDDVHSPKQQEEEKNLEQSTSTQEIKPTEPQIQTQTQEIKPTEPQIQTQTQEIKPTEPQIQTQETKIEKVQAPNISNNDKTVQNNTEPKESTVSSTEDESKPKNIFEKLKNINFKVPSFGKKDSDPTKFKAEKSQLKDKFNNFVKAKLGKKTAQGEEIVGVEITNNEIRLSQISSNKANQWVLDRFYVHKIDLPDDASIIDHASKVSEELNIALKKSKITTPNAAIAIPVTNAIIRVVTAPLMTDEELKKAIDTSSLWENLVQLTDNLDDYSIFHQVINRNPKENTMDILFVASKLSDINNYTSIIKNSGLNPVIIDVKCFALKSAVDQINQISNKPEDANFTALLEFGLDENYVMILYNNNPIITDIFLRGQDRQILKESKDQEEKDALVRRFMTQVKQAVQDFETKYEKRVRNIKVVSNLPNVDDYLSSFRKILINTGFNLFDPFDGLKIPQQLTEKVNYQNRSYFSAVVGLAFRKLDVFGYYKFVTAVKNINLLPDREGMIKQKKMKAFSNFAYKGLVGAVVGIYLILFSLAFWNIYNYNSQLKTYSLVVKEHKSTQAELGKFNKELKKMTATLKLSNTLKSNKDLSYRILAQVASSVPNRVKFNTVEYDGRKQVVITGVAAGDNDILQLIRNLQSKSLVKQASLSSMKMPKSKAGGQVMKGFRVFVRIKG